MNENLTGYSALSDEDLVRRAREDRAAFGALYQRYYDRIYRYLLYRTHNQHDAEDLAGRVFERALQHLGRYQERGYPFGAWLFTIAHNLVANYLRERQRRPTTRLEFAPEPTGDDVVEALEQEDLAALLERAVSRLSPERQHLIWLRYVEELPHAEIARRLGKSEEAVRAQLSRALRTLRQDLARHPAVHDPGSAR